MHLLLHSLPMWHTELEALRDVALTHVRDMIAALPFPYDRRVQAVDARRLSVAHFGALEVRVDFSIFIDVTFFAPQCLSLEMS